MPVSSPSSFFRENGPTPSQGLELEATLAEISTVATAVAATAQSALDAANAATLSAQSASGAASSGVSTINSAVTAATAQINGVASSAVDTVTSASSSAATSATAAAASETAAKAARDAAQAASVSANTRANAAEAAASSASTNATNAGNSATAAATSASSAASTVSSINPASIARTSSANSYTGTQTAPRFANDANHYMVLDANGPIHGWDANDYFSFNRSTDTANWRIGASLRFTLTPTVAQFYTPLVLPSADPTAATHAAHKGYVDALVSARAPLADPQFTGSISLPSAGIVVARSSDGYNTWQDSPLGWAYRWSSINGTRDWIRPGLQQMTLDVSGNLWAAGTITGTSDERLKDVEGPVALSTALSFVQNAAPYVFRYRGVNADGSSGARRFGFLAQDIKAHSTLSPMIMERPCKGLTGNASRGSPADAMLTLDNGLGAVSLLTLALRHALERIAALEKTVSVGVRL